MSIQMDRPTEYHKRVPPWRNVTFLKWAAQILALVAVVGVGWILYTQGAANLEARNIDGMTPLHTATTKKVAQFLIKRGANLNAKAKDGRTPMDMPPVPTPRTGS